MDTSKPGTHNTQTQVKPESTKNIPQSAKIFPGKMGTTSELFIDKLGERLTFESMAIKLYDIAISKFNSLKKHPITFELMGIRDQEVEHVRLLTSALEKMQGETPDTDFNMNNIMTEEVVQILLDPHTNTSQSLNGLLSMELLDNVGWELLIEMAKEANENELISSFKKAWKQEQEHLQTINMLMKNELHS